MTKLEEAYVGISVVMFLVTLSLFAPKPFYDATWGYGRYGKLLAVPVAGLSLILGIFGFSLIFNAKRKKRGIGTLMIATFLATSFLLSAAVFLRITPFEFF